MPVAFSRYADARVDVVVPTKRSKKRQICYVLRGLQGSGKTFYVEYLKELGVISDFFEADQDMYNEKGEYEYDPSKVVLAHKNCRARAICALNEGKDIALSNTFVALWQLKPYLDYCKNNGILMKIISLYDGGFTDKELAENRNQHGVDENTIAKFRQQWEPDILNGNPVNPYIKSS